MALPMPRLAPVTNATPRGRQTRAPPRWSASPRDGDGVGVDTRSQQRTGLRAGEHTPLDDGLAARRSPARSPTAPAYSRSAPPGRSWRSSAGSLATVSGSNSTRSACAPSAMTPRSRRPNSAAGTPVIWWTPSSSVNRPRSAHQLAEHDRRVVGVAHDVDVRAGVGAAEHDALVAPHLAARLPALVGDAHRRDQRREDGGEREPLGDHDVEQHVDRVGARARPATDGDARGRRASSTRSHCIIPRDALRAGGVEAGCAAARAPRGRPTRGASLGVGEGDDLAPSGHRLRASGCCGGA